jgi:hypothetical protein
MNFDLRFPVGFMFSVFGAMLVVFGLLSDRRIYQSTSLGININLYWGIILLIFGAFMLALAWRARRKKMGGPKG